MPHGGNGTDDIALPNPRSLRHKQEAAFRGQGPGSNLRV